jgi:nucleoside-diphosphate-sugar epimerase
MAVFRGFAGRVIVISSADVYHATEIFWRRESGHLEPIPLAEDAPLRRHLYLLRGLDLGAHPWLTSDYEKILVEKIALWDDALPATILRLPLVYGPGDRQHQWLPYLKRMDDARRYILLEQNFANWRASYGYVENIAEAVAVAAENKAASGGTYNISDSDDLSQAEWVCEIASAANWKGRVVVTTAACPLPNFSAQFNTAQHLVMEASLIRRELGYQPVVSRTTSLERTIAWERAQAQQIHPKQLDYGREDAILAEMGLN